MAASTSWISATSAPPAYSTGTRWASTGRAAAGTAACAGSSSTANRLHRRERRVLRLYTRLPARSAPGAIAISSIVTRSAAHERTLFLTSTGFDSILGFDLDAKSFSWGLQVAAVGVGSPAGRSTRNLTTGPAAGNRLHLNNVFCAPGGMYVSGLRTGGVLLFNGREIGAGSRCPLARTTRGRSATACCSTTPRRTSCGS